MKIILILLAGLFFSLSAQSDWLDVGKDLLNKGISQQGSSNLSVGEMSSGLKEALRVGSETVVGQLGSTDGFNADPAIHIPLPNSLSKVKSVLGKVGMSGMLDDLELKLNRAAEVATPKAKKLFGDAISEMTLEDAQKIFNGPDDSATRYFQSKMSPSLAKEMSPIVQDSLADVGAIKSYDNVMGKYEALPLVPDAKANLSEHVVTKAMDGIFHYLAIEEAQIRNNPVKRSTDLLKQVFGK